MRTLHDLRRQKCCWLAIAALLWCGCAAALSPDLAIKELHHTAWGPSQGAPLGGAVALGDGEYFAGVMDASAMLPEGTTGHWSTYFGVTDVDRIVEAIINLGGSVTIEPHDSPYGRLAGVTDPMGAPFSVMAR